VKKIAYVQKNKKWLLAVSIKSQVTLVINYESTHHYTGDTSLTLVAVLYYKTI